MAEHPSAPREGGDAVPQADGRVPDRLAPDLQAFLDWWTAMRPAADRVPRYADVDLMDLWRLASRVVIADLMTAPGEPPRYRWRYAGTEICRIWGMELTGRELRDTHDAETVPETERCYADMAATGAPHYWRRNVGIAGEDKSFLSYQRLAVPFADVEGRITHFASCFVFDRQPKSR